MYIKKLILHLYFISLSTTLFAQYQITIDAFVLDKETNQPIAFSNIGFVNRNIKTISDISGKFTLIYSEEAIDKNDILQISALGYNSLQIRSIRLFKRLKNTDRIYLIPKKFTIDKIISKNNDISLKNGNIYGKVSSRAGPLQSATVSIKNSFIGTETDEEGNYSLDAKKGDVLLINYLGMKEKQLLITDRNEINIELKSEAEILEEVVLKGEGKKEEETIDLGLSGKKNFDAIGTSINVITSEDIGPQYYALGDLLNGRFAALNHSREGSMNNNQGFIYDIDGKIFVGTDTSVTQNISPQNIESITILTSLASTNKYGTIGRGGVIVIKTKTFSGTKTVEPKKSALVKGNDYTEQIPIIGSVIKTPAYITAMEEANSYKEALIIYDQQKEKTKQIGIPFYIDVSNYFIRWDMDFAYTILSNITELAYKSPKALKTLAYKYEELKKTEEAKLIYQRIAVLRPKDAQSYRDLAHIYTETDNYKEAMNLYKQMLYNQIEGIDFTGLQKTIESEIKHLVTVHRTKVNFKGLPSDYLTANFKYYTRVVFEWNDPYAEFELQFVNPQEKYFKWSHTRNDNHNRMLDEIKNGYFTEEYIIEDEKEGEWIINIQSFYEEETMNPTYLKYTIYKNYGLANETRSVKMIKLSDLQQKVTLDKFR